jgi:hypothetical protein
MSIRYRHSSTSVRARDAAAARPALTRLPGMLATAGAAALLAVATPGQAAAQVGPDGDARWLPWVGCWETTDELGQSSEVCFRPEGQGVELLTFSDGEQTDVQHLTADGEPRASSVEGCTGHDAVHFSEDGRRLFLTSEQVCDGDVSRSASGIIAMITPEVWIDVKSVDVEGERMAMIQLYRPAAGDALGRAGLTGVLENQGRAIRTARMAAARAPRPDDVIEASALVHDETVHAWLAEAAEPFDLDARTLTRLADADVAPETIDVMVAVSYPQHFTLNASDAGDVRAAADTRDARDAYGMERGPRSPFHWSPFYSSAYRYRYGFGYDPFFYSGYGYGYGGYGGFGYYGGGGYLPRVIVVQPNVDDGGRAINGRGYTRGSGGSATGRRAVPRGAPNPGAVRGRPGSSTGTASPPPTTRMTPPRKAKRRGGGGGLN